MKTPGLLLSIAGLLLALTFLFGQAAMPDASRHERILDALRALVLNDAALQRDVLKARAGLLHNYDPLVKSTENLDRIVDTLRTESQRTGSDVRPEINHHVALVAAAAKDQQTLVEAFKSRNALLQNSLKYFAHTTRQFDAAGDQHPKALSEEVGRLANAMLRFTGDATTDVANDVSASLSRLAQWPTENADPATRALVSHGRLIVATLPAVDDRVARLLATSTTERALAFQDAYLQLHARAVARASTFRMLLYVASLALVAYVGYLFVRLRANAQDLQIRLNFERLIAAISAQFINLPRDSVENGINHGLSKLAAHADVDRASIVVYDVDRMAIKNSYLWRRSNIGAPTCELADLLWVALNWTLNEYQREGCIHVPDVQKLPDSRQKSCLQRCGIRSWLCIPMLCAGQRVGFLTLDAVSGRKHWPDDDIALSRTAGEILATAIERQRGEADRESLELRLQQAHRLESIGTLAGGIAHEFNNILAAVLGSAELALSTLGRGSHAERHVQRIMTAGARAQAVVQQILTFSRRGERRPRQVLVQPLVVEAVDLLRASLPATVAIETALAGGDATMMADPAELQQVIMNLCTNGAHAMQNRGTLCVELDIVEVDDLALSHGHLSAGRYIRLSVKDTGAGMDAETVGRILEPFFTTKPVGKGTGLGLSTVHGIINQRGGALNIESRIGEGSTFRAYFPHAEEAAVAQREFPGPEIPRGNGETILIVDDDAPLVPLAEEMIASLGYEAVGFNRSAQALESFRATPDRFDLVLTDDAMPEMTGTELADALHNIRPSVPIILMTGGGRPIRSDRLETIGIREVVMKPLLSAAIAELLARHLSSRAD
jgi:signal transduction histidine kinase